MDDTSIVMFELTFIVGVIFSVITLYDLKNAMRKRELPGVGAVTSILSTTIWFIISLLWPGVATTEAFVPLSFLWQALAWTFLVLTFACVAYMLKYSVHPKSAKLEIRDEERPE